ncbi:MAG: hypothetical protein ABIO40_06405 [Devosia sp.]
MLRLILAVLILSAVPALGQQAPEDVDARIDSVLGNHLPYEAAFVDLRAAVEAKNVDALAALIAYGAPIFLNGEQVTLADEAEFKARVAEFFTEEVKAAVMAQTYETLFVNADGIMFGTGQLWLGGTCKDESCADPAVKIIAINTAKGNG